MICPILIFFGLDFAMNLSNSQAWLLGVSLFLIVVFSFATLIFYLKQKTEFEGFLYKVTETTPALIFVFDVGTGKAIFLNSQFTHLMGYMGADLERIQNEMRLLYHPEDLPMAEEVSQAVLDLPDNETLRVTNRIRHSQGHYVWMQTRISIFSRSANGAVKLILGVCDDVSDQKSIEKEKEDLIEQLQKEKLQAQLASMELESARQSHMAAAKLASIGEMAAGVAHEINNPLAVISGKAAAMITRLENAQEPSRDMLVETFKKINFCVDRIARIVRGLKTFSREGSQDPPRILDVREAVQDTLTLCLERYKNNGIDLQVTGLENAIYINCRPVQISQILVNLLGNAFDAVKDLKKPWVKLSLERSHDFLEVRVEDSGEGISEDIEEKIFHPFFTTKEVGQGTGLGLSISTGIAIHHGGSLTLDRKRSRSCFLLQIPLIKTDLQVKKPRSA